MKGDRRLELIKLLLKDIIIKQKEEMQFLKLLNENENLYEIDIELKGDNIFMKIANFLGLDSDEKIFQYIENRQNNIDQLVEDLCKKYDIKNRGFQYIIN